MFRVPLRVCFFILCILCIKNLTKCVKMCKLFVGEGLCALPILIKKELLCRLGSVLKQI